MGTPLHFRRVLKNGAGFSNCLIDGSKMDTRLWGHGLMITSEHDKSCFFTSSMDDLREASIFS